MDFEEPLDFPLFFAGLPPGAWGLVTFIEGREWPRFSLIDRVRVLVEP